MLYRRMCKERLLFCVPAKLWPNHRRQRHGEKPPARMGDLPCLQGAGQALLPLSRDMDQNKVDTKSPTIQARVRQRYLDTKRAIDSQAMDEAQALEQLASQQGMEDGHPHSHLGGLEHITILDHAQLEEVHRVTPPFPTDPPRRPGPHHAGPVRFSGGEVLCTEQGQWVLAIS